MLEGAGIHVMEFVATYSQSQNKQPETPKLVGYWVIILLSSSITLPLLSLHLWLTEFLIELEFLVRLRV